MALVDPSSADKVMRTVEEKYLKEYPTLETSYSQVRPD